MVVVWSLALVQFFCKPTGCSPPGSSIHGLLQARVLEWVVVSSCRGSSQPRDQTCVSCTGRWTLYHWATSEALQATWATVKSCTSLTQLKGSLSSYLGFPTPPPHTEGPDNWGAAASAGTEGEKGFLQHPLCRPEVTWDGVQLHPPSSGCQVHRRLRHEALHLGVHPGALCHLR